MDIQTLLSPTRTRCKMSGGSKKRVLESLAQLIAADFAEIDPDDLFRRLIARERLGSTGIGQGIAIPHCRIDTRNHTIGALLTLADPVDFDSVDSAPVDIIFAMLVPDDSANDHLQTLAQLAEAFQQEKIVGDLRRANNHDELYTSALALSSAD